MITDIEPISDKSSNTSRVYQSLLTSILSGRFAPGSPLRLGALTKEFNVSMTVVREALFRLAEQRLVTLAPNQGFRVVEVSRKDLFDLTEVRTEIECLALRRSVERGDVNWQGRVIAAHHIMINCKIGGPEWRDAHQTFHDVLCEACDNPRLLSMTRSLRNSAEVYRQLYGLSGRFDARDIAREHRMLMEAAIRGDAQTAALLLREHLEKTRDVVLASGGLVGAREAEVE